MKTLHLSIIVTTAVTVSAVIIALLASSYPQNQIPVYQYAIHEPYQGADKNYGTVTIQNQTFHVANLDKMFENKSRPEWIQMYNVNFSFPNGIGMQNTPGGQIMESYVTFPDNPVPYGITIGLGSSLGTPSYDYTTVLSTHKEPQAGFTIHNGTIQLLVNWSKIYSNVSVMGLNDTYRPGQPIDFQVNANGYDNFDAGETPDINITKSDGTIDWKNPHYVVLCCVPELTEYNKKFNFTNLGGPIVLNETGLYKLVVSYNNQIIQKQFMVIQSGIETKNNDILAAKTYNLKQVHYYDSSNLHPKVSLYDYSYDGINKYGLVSIGNQAFYQTTLDNDIYKLKGVNVQFHNVTFSFPEGTLITPGGAFVNLDVKFQDNSEEIYGGTMSSPDGSSTMIGGIQTPTQYGPHLAANSITVLGNHTMPQAGITIYQDKIKLLVSTNQMPPEKNETVNKTEQGVPSCVSKISHQYAIAGPPGGMLCPFMNFEASEKILNATGFYGIYNYPSYPGTLNYVLEPGHNGTIKYLISVNQVHNSGNMTNFNQISITNDVVFMHDAGMHNHPGVDVIAKPKSETIGDNGSALVTMTFSSSRDALPGVYWVTLPPGFCAGGQMIILTVTDCKK